MPSSPNVIDVDTASFEVAVLETSHERPVIVDFWAAWCGPCRQLTPMLERQVEAAEGRVLLAKVDVDANQTLAQRYRVQGIPQVVGFRDGVAIAQFTGVQPEPRIASFIEDLLPTEADQAVARARASTGAAALEELERALELDPGHREAAIGLAEHLHSVDPERAMSLLTPHRPDPKAEAIATRIELAREGGDITALRDQVARGGGDGATLLTLGRALAAEEAYDEALEHLLAAVALGGEVREPAREQLVRLFALLGEGDARVQAARPRLARALF
ncbi:MAG: tetratricopeptide repeat protein [Nitriliruptoraceae bacterium]